MEKPTGYYSFLRHDVLPYIPVNAKKMLSLGCGTAETEGKYRHTHDCHITGIELEPEAAKEAEKKIDRVIVGDVETNATLFKGQTFDCILALDILEHLESPWLTLTEYASLLSPNGVVVASIPNINHQSVRACLQLDVFPYVPAGILDYTHKRFFTLTEIYKLFACAGLKIVTVNPYSNRTSSIQYIVVGKKVKDPKGTPLATVVMLTMNSLEYTRRCIDSLRKNTLASYRTIVVDNGSTDGTQDWLEAQEDIIHIPNVTNLGFPAAFNQALEYISTPYVVIANNDVLFTQDWLMHLIAHAENDDKVGLVGPVSNYVSGPQFTETSNLNTPMKIDFFAQDRHFRMSGQSREFPRLVFFCVLIKSSVFGNIGFLDERFGLGMYEDDDFCLRALNVGYKALIADDVFIYHYGHQTFKANRLNFNEILKQNQKLFFQKWGIPITNK